MHQGGDENENLMDALQAVQDSAPPEENQGFDIGTADINAPSSLVNATEGLVPTGGGNALVDPPPEADPAQLEAFLEAPDPNENPDPAMAVEEMLTAAVLPEGTDYSPEAMDAILPLEPGNTANFELHLFIDDETQRQNLRALAQSQGISLSDAVWAHRQPVISQLTEYQAYAFRSGALAQGAKVELRVNFPLPSLSEEEQALGELASVPESVSTELAEGSPSVTLPKSEKDVMLLTTEAAGGVLVLETLGVVTAHRSIARRFFREAEAQEKLERELKKLVQRPTLPGSSMERLLRDLFQDLKKSALSRKANAVLGIRLEAFPETTHLDPALEQMRLVAFGTAAVVEKT